MTTPSLTNKQKFVVGLWLRIISAGVFLGFLAPLTFFRIDFPFSQCWPAYWGLLVLIGMNGFYWYAGAMREFPMTDFYVHWAIDLILITVVLYGLGGCLLPSSITPYILIVITSAAFRSKWASFLVATGSAIAYIGAIVAEIAGWIDPPYNLALPTMSTGMWLLVVGGPVFMVYIVALIAGTLSDQVNAANALLLLRNDELSERNDKLDKMREEMDFQSRVLTHDIRSPVSAAFSALGELRRNPENAGLGDDHMVLIDMAAENLGRVEDMIDALQQARMGVDSDGAPTSVDLGGVIGELRVEFQMELAAKRGDLILLNELPIVQGNRASFVVLLRNLIVNALRYIPDDGTGIVKVGSEDQGHEDRFFVQDNGPGVPVEFQSAIFDMFRKAPQPVKSRGMGLGLALVKKVAEQHKGRAWVESDGASGSTFWVAIPRCRHPLS